MSLETSLYKKTAAAPAKRGPSLLLPTLMLAVVMIAAGALQLTTGSLWHPGDAAAKSVSGSANTQIQDIADLIKKVARHIVINVEETPTVGTVQDAAMLRKQNPTFYRDTQNGDRLLIWSDKAVLYSPSRDIILSVVPINLTAAAAQAQQAASVTSTKGEAPVIEVLNGSTVSGLGKTLSEKLKSLGFDTLPAIDSRHKDYATTTIFMVSQKAFPQSLKRLLDLTHGKVVSTLPNEAATKADIIVVIGANYKP